MQSVKAALCSLIWVTFWLTAAYSADRPNILFAISDDQSFPHASAYGASGLSTPAFDRIAREGVLFTQAFTASPGCSPARAALLTGRHPWQLEQAGTHASSFPREYVAFPDLLEDNGYFVGFTGKGWGPGDWKISGRDRNPAGVHFNARRIRSPQGVSNTDYAENFRDFLTERPRGVPFCFWYGGHEPHRAYGSVEDDADLDDIVLPPFLPDVPEVRADILAYFREIEWFDQQLEKMLTILEEAGELENTLIIVTSDNGMPFPRAKANCYEYGIRVPLAIRWGKTVKGGRQFEDLVGFVDLTATALEAAGVKPPPGEKSKPAGRSLLSALQSDKQGLVDANRQFVFASRERHSSSRYKNLGYPQRAVRSQDYLYIRNFKPERWPAGAPQILKEDDTLGPAHGAYHDIDASPTLSFLVENRRSDDWGKYFRLAVAKRPEEELYNVREDPGCLKNLVDSPAHAAVLTKLRSTLLSTLEKTGDPRVGSGGDIFETYERYSRIRRFPPDTN